jgi:hypothetical protein
MHDHNLLFQNNKRSILDSHTATADANRSERTQQPMMTATGSIAAVSNMNANHAKSKVTSLIRRKASDLMDDEHDLQYSESPNATNTHYFQLETANTQVDKKRH